MRKFIRHGGEVNNYIGDAILAIFGLKESRQQSLRAVSASVEMLKEMDHFKSYLKQAYGRDFDIRVGVHYGGLFPDLLELVRIEKLPLLATQLILQAELNLNKEAGTRLLISKRYMIKLKKSLS